MFNFKEIWSVRDEESFSQNIVCSNHNVKFVVTVHARVYMTDDCLCLASACVHYITLIKHHIKDTLCSISINTLFVSVEASLININYV